MLDQLAFSDPWLDSRERHWNNVSHEFSGESNENRGASYSIRDFDATKILSIALILWLT
jgi:hypothetical protein